MNAVEHVGYTEPTPIQTQAIGPILEGKDLLGLAQTGTGKTAAFALPILQHLLSGKRCTARALVLSPTRELAEQTRKTFETLGKETGLFALSIYGGVSVSAQIRSLRRDMPEIIVACPGRLLDLMGQHVISLKDIEVLVLDEADQMFDMGFLPSIRKIIGSLPAHHQTLMFSATLPMEIRSLAREFQKEPVRIEISNSQPVETVNHIVYPVMQADKYAVLSVILKESATGQALIFARTKHRAQKLATQLSEGGHLAASLHGNLSQAQRDKAMQKFRSGKVRIMVATDIAARGIDISGISHVINFDMPDTSEAYTHRIGRTGRMMHSGIALTLATPEDRSMLKTIERLVGRPIERKIVSLGDKEILNSMDDRTDTTQKPAAASNGTRKERSRAHNGVHENTSRRPPATPAASVAQRARPHSARRSAYGSSRNSMRHTSGRHPKEYASIP
jgi:ATP-dependent RNA helicase RhlE